MDQVFSTANTVWNFFKGLLNPESYSEVLSQGWLLGVGLVFVVALILVFKGRKRKVEKRRQLEALEEALLDDDDEAHALELPESPDPLSADGLYADYPEDSFDDFENEDLESVPEPLRRTLARDPEFGGQIVISAQSSRKQDTLAEDVNAPPVGGEEDTESSHHDIEQEFAQFAKELKEKQREVQLRHRLEEDLFEESHYQEDAQQPVPIALSLDDMVEEDEFAGDWNQGLDDLLERPEIYSAETTEEGSANRTQEERRKKNERIIQRLEEFQKDIEHKFQSSRLSRLAQENFELVESLGDSDQAREYQEMKRQQNDSLSALETMVFGLGKKKR